jgi:branched-chain amino acid transport system substrate-binding protein
MNLKKSAAQLCVLSFSAFFIFSCASRPIVTAPSRQSQPPRPAKSPEPVKAAPTKKAPEAAPVVVVPPKTPPAPVQEVKIVPKVESPQALLDSRNNISTATDLIENKLSLNQLEAAAADPSLLNFKAQLLLKIGKVYQRNKEIDRASEYFRSVSSLYPQSVYASQAAVLLASLQSSSEADSNVIGAILPLTGRNSSVGQHALNAIRLGLDLTKGETKFRLALFDSQSDADLAAKGVDKLVNEDKVIAIVGGFTSREAYSIATRAELLSVPFIGFSQKPDLTNVGEYVFRNAMTPEMQVNKLVDFAMENLSAKKFAILYPNDSYGVEFSNTFWDHVLARGGQITAAQTYDPKTTDFSEVTQKLVGLYYPEARAEELKQRKQEIRASKKAAAAKKKDNSTPTKTNQRDSYSEVSILPPVVDFDVLFVPDTSRALGQVLAFMKFNEVLEMNYLGTNLWNSADLPKRAANEEGAIYFVDAIDNTDAAHRDSEFFKDYTAAYSEEPTLVEIQAYEAAKIIKQQVVNGANGRESLAAALRTMGVSSAGVTGELQMSPQRDLIRPIHVMMLDAGVVKKLE